MVHHGGSLWGSMIHSLVATDICTGWTEAVPLLAREQSLVVAGLEAIGRQLPFPVKGIASDNDSVFINDTLTQYCAERGIEFTRSRPYRKNDQAWIEQKNGAVVRHYVKDGEKMYRVGGPIVSTSSEKVPTNWLAIMSHHGECDIDPKRTKQTSGSQQPGRRAHDLGPGGRVDGSNFPPHPPHPGGLP